MNQIAFKPAMLMVYVIHFYGLANSGSIQQRQIKFTQAATREALDCQDKPILPEIWQIYVFI